MIRISNFFFSPRISTKKSENILKKDLYCAVIEFMFILSVSSRGNMNKFFYIRYYNLKIYYKKEFKSL